MTTSSVDAEQGEFVIVHRNVVELPTVKPVTPEVGDDGVVIVPLPDIFVQVPLPTAGVFPAKVVVVTLHNN